MAELLAGGEGEGEGGGAAVGGGGGAGRDGGGMEGELVTMGFPRERVRSAIEACGETLEGALQWLIEDADEPPPPVKKQKKQDSGKAHEAESAKPPRKAIVAPAAAAPSPKPGVPPNPAPRKPAAPPEAPAAHAKGDGAASSSGERGGKLAASGNNRSLKRLMKELAQLSAMAANGGSRKLHSFEAEPVDDSDLCASSPLARARAPPDRTSRGASLAVGTSGISSFSTLGRTRRNRLPL